MSNEIPALTPEQEAKIPEYVEKWTNISLSTSESPELDLSVIRPVVEAMYKQAKLKAPLFVLPAVSPYEAYRIQATLTRLEDEVGTKAMSKLSEQEILDRVAADIANTTEKEVHSVQDSSAFSAHCCQCDCDWGALIDFCRHELGLTELTENTMPIYNFLQLCSGALFRHGYVIVIARPTEIHLSDDRLIHHPTRASIRYADNSRQAHFRGISIPVEWVENPEALDPSMALTWSNTEQRRALCEIIGWDKVLRQLDAQELQSDSFGTLLRADLPGNGVQQFVRVTCGTGRTFVIPVSNEAKTCLEAVAETYGMTPEEYAQIEGRS